MTLFEIIIICIVAALFVATIIVFVNCISYIKIVHRLNQQVVTLTNATYECRSFLEKLSKHDVIVKINNISDLQKKTGELIGICKNQTNNITQVRDNLDKSLEDIKMRNNLIKDNHKLLDNINGKTSKMKDDIDKIGEIVVDINKSNNFATINKNIFTAYEDLKEKLLKIDQQYTIITDSINKFSSFKFNKIVEDVTYIREKLGETSVDSEKYVNDINKMLEDILTVSKESKNALNALIKGHNKGIDATSKAFEVINSRNDIADNAIDKTYNDVKSMLKEIAKIGSVLDSYREKVNYIATWVENATKPKTATKTKSIQTKTTKTPIDKKGIQKYL